MGEGGRSFGVPMGLGTSNVYYSTTCFGLLSRRCLAEYFDLILVFTVSGSSSAIATGRSGSPLKTRLTYF